MRSGTASIRCGRPAFPGADGGFTLIEVVAVMAVLGLLLAVALPSLPRGVSRPQLAGLATRVAAVLNGDRRAAMLRHQTVASLVDVQRRVVSSGCGGPSVAVPKGVGLTSALARTCLGAPAPNRIVFLPSGMSCGGAVALDAAGQTIEVTVNWLTGTSRIAARAP